MITRPLELASRLRPEPRSLDWMFFVNAGLLVLFFSLFGSRFVIAPGLELPQVAGARAGAGWATHHIKVTRSLIFVEKGPVSMAELKAWLVEQGAAWRAAPSHKSLPPSLLVQADADVVGRRLVEIAGAADAAGFLVRLAALDESTGSPTTGK